MTHTTVVLAMSADGKIADERRSAARFASDADRYHLEQQIAQADATLFGAGTLRAYETTLAVSQPDLQSARQQRGLPPQPVQIVCSISGDLNRNWRFFQQPVPRWLLTGATGAQRWTVGAAFERILTVPVIESGLDWSTVFEQLSTIGIERLLVMGGAELVATLLAVDRIDELYLTVCPLLLGGRTAPTPVDGCGFAAEQAPRLALCSVKAVGHEVFLHYRRWTVGAAPTPAAAD